MRVRNREILVILAGLLFLLGDEACLGVTRALNMRMSKCPRIKINLESTNRSTIKRDSEIGSANLNPPLNAEVKNHLMTLLLFVVLPPSIIAACPRRRYLPLPIPTCLLLTTYHGQN